MKGKSILITGGAGFIGGRLASQLRDENAVVVMDNMNRSQSALAEVDGVEYVRGDVLNSDDLNDAMTGRNVVIHAAGIAGIDTVGKSPVSTLRVNALGTDKVLQAALRAGVDDRIICFSTSEVFGAFAYDVSEYDCTSVGAVGEPRWTYATSKLMAEHLAVSYWQEFGLPTVVVRPFNVYGPGQIGEGAVRKFIGQALSGQDIVINGDGSQIRAWCFVDDFVDGILRCLDAPSAVGQDFNLGNSRAVVTTLDLAQRIIRLAGSESRIRHQPPLGADVQVRVPDTQKAERLLEFKAHVDLDDGLVKTIEHYRGLL